MYKKLHSTKSKYQQKEKTQKQKNIQGSLDKWRRRLTLYWIRLKSCCISKEWTFEEGKNILFCWITYVIWWTFVKHSTHKFTLIMVSAVWNYTLYPLLAFTYLEFIFQYQMILIFQFFFCFEELRVASFFFFQMQLHVSDRKLKLKCNPTPHC